MKIEEVGKIRYAIVDDFLPRSELELIQAEYQETLDRGLADNRRGENHNKLGFYGTYDAYGHEVSEQNNFLQAQITKTFGTPEKVVKFGTAFGSDNLTTDMILSYHYHLPNSLSGQVHSDYEKVYFKERYQKEEEFLGMNFHQGLCPYRSVTQPEGTIARRRAIAFLYYIGKGWVPGNGGETCFYERSKFGSFKAIKKVAPIENRLLTFEITPHSFHGSVSCTTERRLAVGWYHGLPNADNTSRIPAQLENQKYR